MMDDEQLKTFVTDLQGWFDARIKSLNDTAENIKDAPKLTLDFGEDLKIKLKTPEEVKAYRLGLFSAISAMGEFPVTIENKTK